MASVARCGTHGQEELPYPRRTISSDTDNLGPGVTTCFASPLARGPSLLYDPGLFPPTWRSIELPVVTPSQP